MINRLLLVLLISISFFSCNEDENPAPSPGKYSNGVWVLNEGQFGTGNGSIGFYSFRSQEYTEKVYQVENNLSAAGDVLQSMTLHDGIIYIVANGDNKILRMRARNGEALSSWEFPELDQPRYIIIGGQEVYISNWGPYNSTFGLDDSFILKTDLEGNNRVKIPCGSGPEGMAYSSSQLIVTNSFSDRLEIFNVNTLSLSDTLTVETGPTNIQFDKNGALWFTCSGGFGGTGHLIQLDANFNEEFRTSNQDGMGRSLEFSQGGESAWTFGGNRIFQIDITPGNASQTFSFTGQIYGMVPLNDGGFWYSDPINFQSKGKVYRLDSSGQELGWFLGGVVPNQFIEVD